MKKNVFGLVVVLSLFLFFAGSVQAKAPSKAPAGFPINSQRVIELGGKIYRDLNLSANGNQSCQSCHGPTAAFADPENRIAPLYFPVSDGSNTENFGNRNAPSAAYAGFSPIFHYDVAEGLFIGGLFWDGRASGRMDKTATSDLGAGPTGDPLADQAKGSFHNPVEMAAAGFTSLADSFTPERDRNRRCRHHPGFELCE